MILRFLNIDYKGVLLLFFVIAMILLSILLYRFFIARSMIMPGRLFNEALQHENDGRFEEAELSYQSALQEVQRKKFRSIKLKNKIIGKLKVLNTVIEYSRGRR